MERTNYDPPPNNSIRPSVGTESNDTPRVNLLGDRQVHVVDTTFEPPCKGDEALAQNMDACHSRTNTARFRPPDSTTITVHGVEYDLPTASDPQLLESVKIAESYAMHFLPSQGADYTPNLLELTSKLHNFRDQLSRQSAEARALADAGDYELDNERLNRDLLQLRNHGSFEALFRAHHRKQQETGMNPERILRWLRGDRDIDKILQICSEGVVADTDPGFQVTERMAPIRELQRRLSPVYYKAAATMHDTSKVLLFRIDDLTADERRQIHMANEYHWRPEPGKVAGRPLMDCSNAPPGAIPLNTETTKSRGIELYQRVKLPTFLQVLTQWNQQRASAGLQWTDMWMFKADITGCFNQIHWTPTVSKLMGFMLNATILMIMITCGFGVTVTPMAWSVIGDAMNRTVNRTTPQPVFTFVDDFFGSGTLPETLASQQIVHDTINGVLGPDGVSVKKNVLAQKAEILGILVDYTTGTVRPKDRAIEKMFYLIFSIDIRAPQPLRYWQCLASIINLYAPVMVGLTPFVAPIIHMTHKAHGSRKTSATPNARFAIEVWRVILVRALLNPDSCAIPIGMYLQDTTTCKPYSIVSDASPWRLCAAIYDPETSELLAWATYRLPYERDVAARHQGHREYLGHLFSTILFIAYMQCNRVPNSLAGYQWVNDNNGALAWARKHKCASLAGQYTCFAVTQLHIHAHIHLLDPIHKPGIEMGDIDTMSRIPDGQHPTSVESLSSCPTLLRQRWWPVDELPQLHSLFTMLDPSTVLNSTPDYHIAYNTIYTLSRSLLDALQNNNGSIQSQAAKGVHSQISPRPT